MDPSIPDSISTDDLRSLLSNQLFPPMDCLPSVCFAAPGTGKGTGDLYFLVGALLNKAERMPHPLQVITMLCGILQTLAREHEASSNDDTPFVMDDSLLPPGVPPPTPQILAGIRASMQRQARKLRSLHEDLQDIQSEWLQLSTLVAVKSSPLPPGQAIAEISGPSAILSPEMAASLGLSPEQVAEFVRSIKQP